MSSPSITASLAKILTPVPELEGVEDIPCGICKGAYRRPVRTPCGHTFCLKGIVAWLDSSRTCPTCRDALTIPQEPDLTEVLYDLPEDTAQQRSWFRRGTALEPAHSHPIATSYSAHHEVSDLLIFAEQRLDQTINLETVTSAVPGGWHRGPYSIGRPLTDRNAIRAGQQAANPLSPPLSPASLSFSHFLAHDPSADLPPGQRIYFNARILLSATDRAVLHFTSQSCSAICKHEWKMIRDLLSILFRACQDDMFWQAASDFRLRLQRMLRFSPRWNHDNPEITVLNEEMSRFGERKELLIWWIVKRAASLADMHGRKLSSGMPLPAWARGVKDW